MLQGVRAVADTIPVRILLVGSSEVTDAIAHILGEWPHPHVLEIAPSTAQALARLRSDFYDVLLLNYVPPETDGLNLLRQARDMPAHPLTICLLGHQDQDEAEAVLEAGADDIISHEQATEILASLLDRRLRSIRGRRVFAQLGDRFDSILTHMDATVATMRADGAITSITGPTERLLGVPPEEMVGRNIAELTEPPTSVAELIDALRRVLCTGRPRALTQPRIRPDGQLAWRRMSLTPTGDAARPDEVVVVGQDITEQILAQQALDRRNEELGCLYAVAHALQGKLDAAAAIQAAAEALRGSFLADAVVIGLVGEDGLRSELAASAGFSPEFLRVSGGAFSDLLDVSVSARACHALLATPDSIGELTVHGDLILSEGLRFIACVPGRCGPRLSAVMVLLRRDCPYDAHEVELAERIADNVATAVENARAHDRVAQALRASNRLLEVALAINAHRGLDEVLRAVAAAAADLPSALWAVLCRRDEVTGALDECYPAVAHDRGPREWTYRPFAERAMRERRAVLARPEEAFWPHDGELGDARSVVAVPLVQGSEILGALVIAHRSPREPAEQSRLALQLLASEAAVAIYNDRLLRRVRQSQALYRDLFDLSGVPMIVYRRDGTIEMVNRSFEEQSGYRRDELIGRITVFDLVDPRDRERARRSHQFYWGAQRTLGRENNLRGVRKDGEVRYVRATLYRMPDRDAATAVLLDNTEPLRLQRQLIQSEKVAALGQLVAGVAHELNNPLTTILGHAELLRGTGDAAVVNQAAVIEREAHRSRRIIEGLLSFARERPPQFAPTDVNAAVEEVLRIPAYRMKVDNIEVLTDLVPELPVIEADSHQLQQVFLNIINNAHFAMRTTGGRLAVSSRLVGRIIEVTFSDTGPGMNEEQIGRAFDPFYTTKQVNEGTGLGLSISLGIVRRHGGEIVINSAPGEGATVTVRLPVRGAPFRAPEQPQVAVAAARTARVLVVDDEQPLLDLVRQALGGVGHEVHTACDAMSGLRLLEQHTYDVILSDLRMPGMDGEQFHRRVAERWPEMASRFVIVTGDTLAAETGQFLGRPDIRALCKPFTIAELRETVAMILAEHEQ